MFAKQKDFDNQIIVHVLILSGPILERASVSSPNLIKRTLVDN